MKRRKLTSSAKARLRPVNLILSHPVWTGVSVIVAVSAILIAEWPKASLPFFSDEAEGKGDGKASQIDSVLPPEIAGGASRGDRESIQGGWRLVAMEADGEQAREEVVAPGKFLFDGNSLAISPGEPGSGSFEFALDPSTIPPGFTMTKVDGRERGKTTRGIYRLEGDRLEICLGLGSEVPTDFTTAEGSSRVLYSLRRD